MRTSFSAGARRWRGRKPPVPRRHTRRSRARVGARRGSVGVPASNLGGLAWPERTPIGCLPGPGVDAAGPCPAGACANGCNLGRAGEKEQRAEHEQAAGSAACAARGWRQREMQWSGGDGRVGKAVRRPGARSGGTRGRRRAGGRARLAGQREGATGSATGPSFGCGEHESRREARTRRARLPTKVRGSAMRNTRVRRGRRGCSRKLGRGGGRVAIGGGWRGEGSRTEKRSGRRAAKQIGNLAPPATACALRAAAPQRPSIRPATSGRRAAIALRNATVVEELGSASAASARSRTRRGVRPTTAGVQLLRYDTQEGPVGWRRTRRPPDESARRRERRERQSARNSAMSTDDGGCCRRSRGRRGRSARRRRRLLPPSPGKEGEAPAPTGARPPRRWSSRPCRTAPQPTRHTRPPRSRADTWLGAGGGGRAPTLGGEALPLRVLRRRANAARGGGGGRRLNLGRRLRGARAIGRKSAQFQNPTLGGARTPASLRLALLRRRCDLAFAPRARRAGAPPRTRRARRRSRRTPARRRPAPRPGRPARAGGRARSRARPVENARGRLAPSSTTRPRPRARSSGAIFGDATSTRPTPRRHTALGRRWRCGDVVAERTREIAERVATSRPSSRAERVAAAGRRRRRSRRIDSRTPIPAPGRCSGRARVDRRLARVERARAREARRVRSSASRRGHGRDRRICPAAANNSRVAGETSSGARARPAPSSPSPP